MPGGGPPPGGCAAQYIPETIRRNKSPNAFLQTDFFIFEKLRLQIYDFLRYRQVAKPQKFFKRQNLFYTILYI